MPDEHRAPLPALEQILFLVNSSNKDADQNLNNLTQGSLTSLLRGQGSALTQKQFWIRLFQSFFGNLSISRSKTTAVVSILVFAECTRLMICSFVGME